MSARLQLAFADGHRSAASISRRFVFLLIISTCPLKSAISTLVIMVLSQPLQDVWLWRSGDRGFDPLGLAKPNEYLQYDVDEADQNKGKNVQGAALGKYNVPKEAVSVKDPLSPYNEVRCLHSALETS